jgi:hypothetical protein
MAVKMLGALVSGLRCVAEETRKRLRKVQTLDRAKTTQLGMCVVVGAIRTGRRHRLQRLMIGSCRHKGGGRCTEPLGLAVAGAAVATSGAALARSTSFACG